MAFGDKGGGDKKPKDQAPGLGAQHELHNPRVPMGPKPGQGMNPMEAMMFGMGDLGHLAPPAPQAPMGPNGLPIGGNLPSSDPMMDPNMDGSSLFQALNMQLDPMAAAQGGPPGEPGAAGLGDGMPGLEELLNLLALQQAGLGGQGGPTGNMNRLNPSGVFNEPTHPGETIGLNPFQVTQ